VGGGGEGGGGGGGGEGEVKSDLLKVIRKEASRAACN